MTLVTVPGDGCHSRRNSTKPVCCADLVELAELMEGHLI
jgi:hypothetical protein